MTKPSDIRSKKETLAVKIGDYASMLSPRLHRSPSSVRRIGVLSQWGIGDAVLLLPLLRGLRNLQPDAEIELIGKPWLADLFEGEDCCDRTHLLVPPWTSHVNKYRDTQKWTLYLKQLRDVRSNVFDWLISPRYDVRDSLQLRLLRSRKTFGFHAVGGRFWIDHDVGISRRDVDAIHRAALSDQVLSSITGLPANSASISFLNRPPAEAAAMSWLKDQGYANGPILAVHSGASNPIRQWRQPHFDNVLEALPTKPALTVFIDPPGGTSLTMPHANWHGTLAELKALLKACHFFLGTDSGPMHMAAAAGCKIVTPFGPNHPRWFGPVGQGHDVIMVDEMPCRPCFDTCIYSSPKCFDQLDETRITAALATKVSSFTAPI